MGVAMTKSALTPPCTRPEGSPGRIPTCIYAQYTILYYSYLGVELLQRTVLVDRDVLRTAGVGIRVLRCSEMISPVTSPLHSTTLELMMGERIKEGDGRK